MFQLELNDREQRALSDALQIFLSELRTEVSHTDRQAYRLQLKEQEQVLKGIAGKLGG
jgi:RNA polymerase-interacting CarD/CdnL/TRCF family regulator